MEKEGKTLSHSSSRCVGWLAGLLLGIALIFTLFYIESSLGASFFVLSTRNMAPISFSSGLVSSNLDSFIWGALCLMVAVSFLLGTVKSGVSKRLQAAFVVLLLGLVSTVCIVLLGLFSPVFLAIVSMILLAICVLCAGIMGFSRFGMIKCAGLGSLLAAFVVEVGALVTYNLPFVLNLSIASSAFALHWRLVELSLANWAYPIVPYAYLAFMLIGIAAYLWELIHLDGLSKKLMNSMLGNLQVKVELLKQQTIKSKSASFPLGLAIVISFALSVFFVVITQLSWINPTHRLIAVDAPSYYQWMATMRGLDAGSALRMALQNDRALFLLSSYALSFAFPKVSVIQFMAALLVPIFTLVSLYLVRFVCGFRETWLYVVLIAPFSVQALGLIYSGYFANMLAGIFVYLYFALFLKFRCRSIWSILLLLGVSLLVLFSHSWTWYVFVISLVGFLLLEWRNTSKEPIKLRSFKNVLLTIALTVVVGLGADYTRTLLVSKSASGIVVFKTASSGLSLPNANVILNGLQVTTNSYLGGVFSSALLLGSSILGFLFLLTYRSASSRLLVSWFVVGCVAVIFASGEYVFNRFIFLMPSLIFSAIGLTVLVRSAISNKNQRWRLFLELLIVGLVFMLLLNFAINYTSNVNIV